MIRTELISNFRAECPEIDINVISDAILQNWLFTGDKEICAATRCIVGETTFNTVINDTKWDLTAKIPNFYDINEWPGGGVNLDGDRLTKTTKAELDDIDEYWRQNGAGNPEFYFRYGKYIYTEMPVDSVYVMIVDAVLVSDDYNADVMPFNQLPYLVPFHWSLVLYLIKKAKAKVGKPDEAAIAEKEFTNFIAWMKKEVQGGMSSKVLYRQPNGQIVTPRYRR